MKYLSNIINSLNLDNYDDNITKIIDEYLVHKYITIYHTGYTSRINDALISKKNLWGEHYEMKQNEKDNLLYIHDNLWGTGFYRYNISEYEMEALDTNLRRVLKGNMHTGYVVYKGDHDEDFNLLYDLEYCVDYGEGPSHTLFVGDLENTGIKTRINFYEYLTESG